MTVTPWKLRSMGLNENRLNAGQLREGARVSIRNFDTVTEYTKAPDYLQVPLLLRYYNEVKSTTTMSNLQNVSSLHKSQESELIALMDEHGIGTDASIPQVFREQ